MHRYLIATGSNMRRPGVGGPRRVLERVPALLQEQGAIIVAQSSIIASAPLGPSLRTYANGAIVMDSDLTPLPVLAMLQGIESSVGRNRRGSRWRARPLDLDIILWNGGIWRSPDLTIPHPLFRERPFVLSPAAEIAPTWHDPITGRTLRQLAAILRKRETTLDPKASRP